MCDGAAVSAGSKRGVFRGAGERADPEAAASGSEGPGDWRVQPAFIWRNRAAAAGAVCDVAAGTSRPRARIFDLRGGVRGDAFRAGADAAGIVAERAGLDAAATQG